MDCSSELTLARLLATRSSGQKKTEVRKIVAAVPSCAYFHGTLGCLGVVSCSPRTLRLKLISTGQIFLLVPWNFPSTNFGARL